MKRHPRTRNAADGTVEVEITREDCETIAIIQRDIVSKLFAEMVGEFLAACEEADLPREVTKSSVSFVLLDGVLRTILVLKSVPSDLIHAHIRDLQELAVELQRVIEIRLQALLKRHGPDNN